MSLFKIYLYFMFWPCGFFDAALKSLCRVVRTSAVAPAQLLHGMWDVSYPARDRAHILCIARQILNCWTTREVTVCCVRLSGGKSAILGANSGFSVVIVPLSVQETLIILSELRRVPGKNL